MLKVAGHSQRLIADFLKRWASHENPGPLDPLNVSGAFFALLKAMGADRETVMETQLQFWRDWMGLWEITARRMLGGEVRPRWSRPRRATGASAMRNGSRTRSSISSSNPTC